MAQAGDAADFGQVVRIERSGGLGAHLVGAGDRAVIVPWDYGPDCRAIRRGGSVLFAEPGRRGLYAVTLRQRFTWAADVPTYDATFADFEPYPWGRSMRFMFRHPKPDRSPGYDPAIALTPDQLFDMYETVGPGNARTTAGLMLGWARSNPALAEKYPVPTMVRWAQSERRPKPTSADP